MVCVFFFCAWLSEDPSLGREEGWRDGGMLLSLHQLQLSTGFSREQEKENLKNQIPNFGAPPLHQEVVPFLPAEDTSKYPKYLCCRFPNPPGAPWSLLGFSPFSLPQHFPRTAGLEPL